ncbi:unnamed protein product, partial [Enterobius vermicularis]|uniref:Sulfate_transp domain-containing protein n=1 Tax=Enterobius vermicularis TaxID=51028 RepID=A0A0N4V6S4_ENTVE
CNLHQIFFVQQVSTCISSIIAIPYVISSEICPGADLYKVRTTLVSVALFISGLTTIIQTEAGMRLALLQGPSYTFLAPVHMYLSQTKYVRIKKNFFQIAGSLAASAIIPFLAGITGIAGTLRNFIGPITVSTMLFLVMYSTIEISLQRISMHWMSLVQIILLTVSILFLCNVECPLPSWKNGSLSIKKYRLFERYSYLIAILITWGCCLLLSITNATTTNSAIRLDRAETITALQNAPWFRIPKLGEYGTLKFNLNLFIGCVVAAFLTVIETIGTYHTAALVSEETVPPSHALNRGMIVEGLGTALAGLFHVGSGICTFAANVGIMETTKVTRSMMVVAGLILISAGLFTKVGAVLSAIPDPLVGAIIAITSATAVGIAFSYMQLVDLSVARNMAIVGWSLVFGIMTPKYFTENSINIGK